MFALLDPLDLQRLAPGRLEEASGGLAGPWLDRAEAAGGALAAGAGRAVSGAVVGRPAVGVQPASMRDLAKGPERANVKAEPIASSRPARKCVDAASRRAVVVLTTTSWVPSNVPS